MNTVMFIKTAEEKEGWGKQWKKNMEIQYKHFWANYTWRNFSPHDMHLLMQATKRLRGAVLSDPKQRHSLDSTLIDVSINCMSETPHASQKT